jgi:hypothetical protein
LYSFKTFGIALTLEKGRLNFFEISSRLIIFRNIDSGFSGQGAENIFEMKIEEITGG